MPSPALWLYVGWRPVSYPRRSSSLRKQATQQSLMAVAEAEVILEGTGLAASELMQTNSHPSH